MDVAHDCAKDTISRGIRDGKMEQSVVLEELGQVFGGKALSHAFQMRLKSLHVLGTAVSARPSSCLWLEHYPNGVELLDELRCEALSPVRHLAERMEDVPLFLRQHRRSLPVVDPHEPGCCERLDGLPDDGLADTELVDEFRLGRNRGARDSRPETIWQASSAASCSWSLLCRICPISVTEKPAVDGKSRAGNPAGVVGGEVHSRRGDVLARAEPSHGMEPDDLFERCLGIGLSLAVNA